MNKRYTWVGSVSVCLSELGGVAQAHDDGGGCVVKIDCKTAAGGQLHSVDRRHVDDCGAMDPEERLWWQSFLPIFKGPVYQIKGSIDSGDLGVISCSVGADNLVGFDELDEAARLE